MTLAELEEKYPDFDYFGVGINNDVYKFELDDDDDNLSIEIELSCPIEHLLNDKDFINWLDEQFESRASVIYDAKTNTIS